MSDLDDVLYAPLFPSQNSLHSALDQAKKKPTYRRDGE